MSINTLLRSTVPSGADCSRSTKRFVRSPRDVSYLEDLPGDGAGGTAVIKTVTLYTL